MIIKRVEDRAPASQSVREQMLAIRDAIRPLATKAREVFLEHEASIDPDKDRCLNQVWLNLDMAIANIDGAWEHIDFWFSLPGESLKDKELNEYVNAISSSAQRERDEGVHPEVPPRAERSSDETRHWGAVVEIDLFCGTAEPDHPAIDETKPGSGDDGVLDAGA